MTRTRIILATSCLVLGALIAWSWATHDRSRSTADRLLLLVPDGTSFSNPKVTMWLDAGSEEGLHVIPVHDSEFLRPLLGESKCAGVILPDSIHQQASDVFIATLHRFVADGGKLMLVYDAGTFSLSGAYAAGRSRLSDLAGVDYALYDKLGDKTTQWGTVTSTVPLLVKWKYLRENTIRSMRKVPPPLQRVAHQLSPAGTSRSSSGATNMEICSIPAS